MTDLTRWPLLLDLFCCAGGAAEGYRRAGFDVVGVDLAPQKNYPFAFIQADVLSLDQRFLRMFDAIHASPPCQWGTSLRHAPGTRSDHLNLIPQTRAMLQASGRPYIIENVDSPAVRPYMRGAITLCGSMFGLGAQGCQLQRHRLFTSNIRLPCPSCQHDDRPVIGCYGGHARRRSAKAGGRGTKDEWIGGHRAAMSEALGITWATCAEMSESIPPAYTEYLGRQLIQFIQQERGV